MDIVPTVLSLIGERSEGYDGLPLDAAEVATSRPLYAYVMKRDGVPLEEPR